MHFRYLDHVSCVHPVVVGLCVRQILVPADNKSKPKKQQNRATKNVTVEGASLYTYIGEPVRSGCFFSKDWSDSQFQVCSAQQVYNFTISYEELFLHEDNSLLIISQTCCLDPFELVSYAYEVCPEAPDNFRTLATPPCSLCTPTQPHTQLSMLDTFKYPRASMARASCIMQTRTTQPSALDPDHLI